MDKVCETLTFINSWQTLTVAADQPCHAKQIQWKGPYYIEDNFVVIVGELFIELSLYS